MSTRSRVMSFMSSFGSNRDSERSPTPVSSRPRAATVKNEVSRQNEFTRENSGREPFPAMQPMQSGQPQYMNGESPQPRAQRERASSRPMSMAQAYQPPLMDVNQDTLPELQPIFTFLNSHSNKLYQEGYFLKLDDQNTHGRPNADRTWAECFAQLVGTVLSLWDAAELDAAGQDGEVLPKFINLTDASIKMITSLPTRSDNEAPLQNVLSISTAGKNRYLLHFNSHHSLIQWTAGIRLAMFEHATLQEAYTGALIAGKGKALNNINIIMERARMPTADWARVRFGAGTPWRRCWCVITPPDEKELQKLQKQVNKKKSAYDRSPPPILKGDIKFYDSKKTKKMKPIATISDAYSAFAIYPQSKPLIDASTLVKVEGSIIIHSNPPTTSEGFVFVMPEVHPAVTGFEMLLRWLFPVFDTFGLYGRPGRLAADTSDTRSLMFAMPKHRRYGYLEILDVSGLILETGSENWKEGEWRKRMKELTSKRMTAVESGSQRDSRYSSRRSTRNSFGPSRTRIQFDDAASVRSSPSVKWNTPEHGGLPRTDSAPAAAVGSGFSPSKAAPMIHQRSVSETHGLDRYQESSQGYDGAYDAPPPLPPPHIVGVASGREALSMRYRSDMAPTPERNSSEDELAARTTPIRELQDLQQTVAPEPVAAPPAFAHGPGSMPPAKAYHSPELRRANSRMSSTTLDQLAGAGGMPSPGYHAIGDDYRGVESQRGYDMSQYSGVRGQRGVLLDANTNRDSANHSLNKGPIAAPERRFSFERPLPTTSVSNESANHSHPVSTHLYQAQANSSTNQASASRPTTGTQVSRPLTGNSETLSNSLMYISPQVSVSQDSIPPRPTRIAGSPSHLQSSPSAVLRKPLPTHSAAIPNAVSATTSSQHVDKAVSAQAVQDGRETQSMPQDYLQRQNSGVSSVYDEEIASTTSPDYASTRRSVDTQQSVEKPRAGVMKTVGKLEKTTSNESRKGPALDIDFGPSLNLNSDRQIRGQSPGPALGLGRGQSSTSSPAVTMHTERIRQDSPGRGLDNARSSPSRNVVTPDGGHYRNNSTESRTVAWQPGMAMNTNVGQAITPEQFVQQRATMATATPLYAHQRQQSANTLRGSTPTPPLTRNRSSELLMQQGHSRNNSADLLQRPSSRGASVTLGPSGSGDLASTLSAREQEHIARMTGQPLINMAQNNNKQVPGAGLVGAIEAREKEKMQIKQGINSQAVQQAIHQRQQQAVLQQQQAIYQQQYADQMGQQQYGTMGQYPQNLNAQRQQAWVSPASNVYAQGGGFSAPSQAWTGSPDGRQSPSQYPARGSSQPQYFAQQQQGRGNGAFNGHGN